MNRRLPEPGSKALHVIMEEVELGYLIWSVSVGGNHKQMAERLGLQRTTFIEKIKRMVYHGHEIPGWKWSFPKPKDPIASPYKEQGVLRNRMGRVVL